MSAWFDFPQSTLPEVNPEVTIYHLYSVISRLTLSLGSAIFSLFCCFLPSPWSLMQKNIFYFLLALLACNHTALTTSEPERTYLFINN